jgi:hypothetical protein
MTAEHLNPASASADETKEQLLDWKAFLEDCPPDAPLTVRIVSSLYPSGGEYAIANPALQLYCGEPECESIMWFDHYDLPDVLHQMDC